MRWFRARVSQITDVFLLTHVYRAMLLAYPRTFRQRFGAEMSEAFRERHREAVAQGRVAGFVWTMLVDWIFSCTEERIVDMQKLVKKLAPVAGGLIALVLVGSTALQAFYIPSRSMEGSLHPGDHILVNKMVKGEDVRRGDVIAYKYRDGHGEIYVKRVIGVGGDRIQLSGERVVRNGATLNEPYARHDAVVAPQKDDVTVPAGEWYVLGDNRDHSKDSRSDGFVRQEDLVGRVMFVYWGKGDGRVFKGLRGE